MSDQDSVPVSCVLGHRDVATGVRCLESLLRYSSEALRFRIHDDGSLTEDDLELLAEVLNQPKVIRRLDADGLLKEKLSDRPASARFRHANPLALKLIDVVELSNDRRVAYCDSDVLFLRPFKNLFHFPSEKTRGIFMMDWQSSYSIRSWQVLLDKRLKLSRRVNAGIIHFKRTAYDPEVVEWFLSKERYHRTPAWVDQTCWALLGARAECHLLDPRWVRLAPRAFALPNEVVALHFVNPVRGWLPEAIAAAPDRRGEPPVAVSTRPAKRCSWLSLAVTEVRRRLARGGGASGTLRVIS